MTQQSTGPRPGIALPRSVRVGYGLGSLGTGASGTVPGLVLLYYLTDVLAVPVALPKAWDVVANPLIGAAADRSRAEDGSRRPFLLIGALTLPPPVRPGLRRAPAAALDVALRLRPPTPLSAARSASWVFQPRVRWPSEPPPSAVMSSRRARG
ncbi:MAG: MFS transporter [Streptomyces sp.]|nr:MFS transporter [Streptomyces sp.]